MAIIFMLKQFSVPYFVFYLQKESFNHAHIENVDISWGLSVGQMFEESYHLRRPLLETGSHTPCFLILVTLLLSYIQFVSMCLLIYILCSGHMGGQAQTRHATENFLKTLNQNEDFKDHFTKHDASRTLSLNKQLNKSGHLLQEAFITSQKWMFTY